MNAKTAVHVQQMQSVPTLTDLIFANVKKATLEMERYAQVMYPQYVKGLL
jgi:hypothetical protein